MGVAHVRSERWVPALATLLALLLVAAAAEVVIDGSAGLSPLIPKSPQIAGWLTGAGERLGYRVFLIALLVSSGAYLGLIVIAGRSVVSPTAPTARAALPRWRDLQTLGDRARRGAAADRVRRSDPDLDRRLQLHRLRPHGQSSTA